MADSAPTSMPQSLAGPRCVALALVLTALGAGPASTLAQSGSRADSGSDWRARQPLSVQLGGQGGTYSVHYSRRLSDRWSWRSERRGGPLPAGGGLFFRATVTAATGMATPDAVGGGPGLGLEARIVF